MTHAVTHPDPPFLAAGGALRVHVFPAWQDNLVWVIECVETGACAVVDAPDADVLEACAARGLHPTTILNTHTHPDHIGINRALERTGRLGAFSVVGFGGVGVPGLTTPVDEGDVVSVGALRVLVLRTEGHQNGHLSYLIDDVVFCGDVMFGAGCGYLFDGPPAKMHASLERLAALPPETRVCCAHEYTEDNLRFAWTVEPENAPWPTRIRRVWALRAAGRATVPFTIARTGPNPFLRHHAPGLRARVAARAARPAPHHPGRDLRRHAGAEGHPRAYKTAGEPAVGCRDRGGWPRGRLLASPRPSTTRWLLMGATAGVRLLEADSPAVQVGGGSASSSPTRGASGRGSTSTPCSCPRPVSCKGPSAPSWVAPFLGLDAGLLGVLDEDQHPHIGAQARVVATLAFVGVCRLRWRRRPGRVRRGGHPGQVPAL
ncbi:MAG: hydroxyacylglutathione hydrolase [bacterium]